MAEFKISRIRYTWKGDWGTGTNYNRDDIVRYGGSSWICIRQHTASAFKSDQEFLASESASEFSPAWIRMTSGYAFRGAWVSSTLYNAGDVISYGGYLYLSNTEHTSNSSFENDSANWNVYLDSIAWNLDWSTNTDYGVGDLVKYGGIIYKCIDAHTSTSTVDAGLEVDQNNWEIYFEGIEFKGIWTTGTRYKVNDLVEHNGYVWRCKQGHTPGSDSTINFDSNEFWTIELPGSEYDGDWLATSAYSQGDIVRYGGFLYESLTDNYGIEPFEGFVNENWRVLSKGINFRGLWNSNTEYNTGDVVKRGGNLYVAVSDIVNDGSSLDYLDSGDWELIVQGQNWRGNWESGIVYNINDIVIFNGSTYIATFAHTSNNTSTPNFPGDNGEGIDYWDLLIEAPTQTGMNSRGDLLTYDLFRSEIGDGSSLGAADVNIGTEGELLSINDSDSLYYKNYGVSNRVFYVDTSGIDDIIDSQRGHSPYKPWKTVRFACEQADDGFSGTTTVKVNTGVYEEILPISVPVRTVVLGSELRSTTIKPNTANADLSNDYTFFPTALDRISQLIESIVSGNELDPVKTSTNVLDPVVFSDIPGEDITEFTVTVSNGELFNTSGEGNVFYLNGQSNPALQLVRGKSYTFVQTDPTNTENTIGFYDSLDGVIPYTDGIIEFGILGVNRVLTFEIPEDAPDTLYYSSTENGISLGGLVSIVDNYAVIPITTSNQAALDIQDLIIDVKDYIDFTFASGETNPDLVGTNSAITSEGYLNAIRHIEANIPFLQSEIVAYMRQQFSSYNFDESFYRKETERFLRAFVYDITYTGNYKTLLESRYYRNEINGSLTEDMFYCRDTTGVRDCTLEGLTAGLNPPGVFDLYQRPLGGAYVSLDPGWGPADDRCWIINRSPYIQGVTTIGTGCVGQKVDGDLHNGGNKSIVSNDFTQVISDGIGAWVLNNARAELVSVFSYYAQVGYLAERGGVIRATNGNSSYGNYGVIADGVDPDEVPLSASVYNRNQEAQVASAFSGDFTDEILILEWNNAGQNYTEATGEITGAGANADIIFEEFRDNALFNSRLLDANDNRAIDSIGGGGYTLNINNAQISGGDDATSIIISANDSNTFSDYNGKRIIITSGIGTGQYGYVTAYNVVSKEVTVARESDNQPGWDHLVPGTPLVPFDSTTTYRIEPRVTFSDPGFTATEIDVQINTSWSAIVYGETSETFTAVDGQLGTGDVVDFDGLVPVAATFNVVRTGRDYVVEINNAGLGYAVGDTITLSGDDLGGTTPLNDITIEITGITDDSSNSITTFNYDGVGVSGKWVATSEQGTAALYSSDGDSWTSFNMPVTGNWTNLAAGNGVFVAIQSDDNINDASDIAAYSYDGITWTQISMPAQQVWSGVTYGNGVFVAISSDGDTGALSTDGVNWTSTTLPDIGDSTDNNWIDITYGRNIFVAIANSNNVSADGVYDPQTGTISWTGHILDVIADSSQVDWRSVAWGNNRFVAISSEGFIGYSFDGISWSENEMPKQDGSTAHHWNKVRYGNGLFFAIGDTGGRDVGADPTTGPSTYAITSPDGITWTDRELAVNAVYKDIAFGNPYINAEDSSIGLNTPIWIIPGYNTDKVNKVRTGKRALGRVTVSSGLIGDVRIWDPGSGYQEDPTITITDPNSTSDASCENRIADGVLTNPTWLNRGIGYRSLSTEVEISGNGFADIIPSGNFITLEGLTRYPELGSQLTFAGNDELFNIVTITELGDLGSPTDGLSIRIRVSPTIRVQDKIENGTAVTIRERVAQARISNHDFLDIGTGNFIETNYPDLYQDYNFTAAPENEVYEEEGGRVFYTSSDQGGNFRTGELFAVEQATGIVTISSDFFNLDGLSELRLGGIRVGGSGVVIREFSTDPTLQEDSNNVVPTQRAIATFLASRLSLGGTEIEVNGLTAGVVNIGPLGLGHSGGADNAILFRNIADFSGPNSGISGGMLAQTMFYASFDKANN